MLNGLALLLQRARYDRLVIAGGPGVGKTTLSEKLQRDGLTIHGSDELKDLEWSTASLKASHWFDRPGPWICEGVAMPRALRKWLLRSADGSPCDAILWLAHPVEERSRGQHVMALGCATVWNEIRDELRKRGVTLLEADET